MEKTKTKTKNLLHYKITDSKKKIRKSSSRKENSKLFLPSQYLKHETLSSLLR